MAKKKIVNFHLYIVCIVDTSKNVTLARKRRVAKLGCCISLKKVTFHGKKHGNRRCVRLNFCHNNDKPRTSSRILRLQTRTLEIFEDFAFFLTFQRSLSCFCFARFCFHFSFSFFLFSDAKNGKSSCCENDDFPLGKFDVLGLGEQGLRMAHLKATSAFVFFMFSFFPLLCLFFLPIVSFKKKHTSPAWDGSVWVGPPTWEKT